MADVVVPWSGGCPHREAAWRWVRSKWEDAGHNVIEATWTGPRWCKARAVASGVDRGTNELVVVADADVWTDGIGDAIDGLRTHRWAVPHLVVHRLSQPATGRLVAGGPADLDDLDNPKYFGIQGGGVVAIHRSTYLDVPLDPRFEGWGGEDHAWGIALHHLAGSPWTGRADLIHLWHPPQDEAPDIRGPSLARHRPKIPDPANNRLNHRYRDAKVSRTRMRALVDEAREALWPTPASS